MHGGLRPSGGPHPSASFDSHRGLRTRKDGVSLFAQLGRARPFGAAIHQCFADVFARDALRAGEVGDGARNAHDAVERARATACRA